MSDEGDHLLHALREALVPQIHLKQPDLTLRQLAVLLVVYLTDERQTVRGLADRLEVPKYVIFRALNRLVELGLARQVTNMRRHRSVTVCRTVDGAALMRRLRAAMAEAASRLDGALEKTRHKGAHAALCAIERAESSEAMPEQPGQTIDDGAYQSQVFFEGEDADLDELHPTEWLILHIEEDDVVAHGWAATPRAAQVAAAKALAEAVAGG